MIVYFEKPTIINQHGLIQECLFLECVSMNFNGSRAIVSFDKSGNDICIININSIKDIK